VPSSSRPAPPAGEPGNAGAGPADQPPEDGRQPPGAAPGRRGSTGSGNGPAGNALDRLATPVLPGKPDRPAVPPPPVRWFGSRDWNIYIDCTADAVVLQPQGTKFTTEVLASSKAGENPLAQAVQALIARRQATVRPGEPPYRPCLRFRVLPGGLRAFHLAYPVLEPLQVPMTRESLEPD
jgi:hypothetical protein